MKKAFSLLELIFVLVILGIIATFAVPKYLTTKEYALASTIKRDIVTLTTSIQTYNLVNGKIDKISNVLTLNNSNWEINDNKLLFKNRGQTCIDFSVNETKISIVVSKDSSNVCKILDKLGVKTQDIDLL